MRNNSVLARRSSIIWVLIANGDHSQCYHYRTKEVIPSNQYGGIAQSVSELHELIPIPGMSHKAESLDDFHVGHDDRGSLIGGQFAAHNSCEPRLDIHDEVKNNLVNRIAKKLNHFRNNQSFDCLVIAASPKILGSLRQSLNTNVLSTVIAEISRDFSNDDTHALLTHLQNTLIEARVA